jgi:type III pantothenate kinase
MLVSGLNKMLLIDVGNSQIKCAESGNITFEMTRTLAYQKYALQDQFDQLFQGYLSQPVFVSCVVEDMKEPLSKWFQDGWSVQPVFVAAVNKMCGVVNGYSNPETLGVDRWLAMVAAYNKFKTAVCVIDCGTAVTVDVVDVAGVHQGGLIMPGLQLMRESLFGNTSKIVSAKGELVELAMNTKDAVESGCCQLLVYGLDNICQRQQAVFPDLRIVVTGGNGEYISRIMQADNVFISTLVLDGLRLGATRGS